MTRQQRRALERAEAKAATKERSGHATRLRERPLPPPPQHEAIDLKGEDPEHYDARHNSYLRAGLEHLLSPRVGAALIAEFDALMAEQSRLAAEAAEDLPADQNARVIELEQCFRAAASEQEILGFLRRAVLPPGEILPFELGMPPLDLCDPDELRDARARIAALPR